MKPRPTVIVLAAGRGNRLQDQLTQRLGGASVLAMTLHHALASHLPVLVVTTPALSELVSQHVATRDIVVMPAAASLGHAIAAGVSARSNASGWLVLPADMPLVRPATLRAVAHELDHHPVAFAQHHGLRGHPVGFAAELYSELVMLTGDHAPRRLVSRYPAQEVEVDDPGVLLDVDTEDRLAQVRGAHEAVSAAASGQPG